MHKNYTGITLIELITVIAIVSLIAAFGYPSYKNYLLENRRYDGSTALYNNQLIVEDYYSENNITPTLGQINLQSPSQGGFYTISYTRTNDQTYVLTATPTGSQASDSCQTLILQSWLSNVLCQTATTTTILN